MTKTKFLHALLLLLFFQLLSDFVESIYVFGLLGTNIPPEIACVLLFLAPAILLILPRALSGRPLLFIGELMLLCRVAAPLLDPRGKMLISGLGVACSLLLLPSLLHQRQSDHSPALEVTTALSLSILLRTLGSGTDLSTRGPFQFTGWVMALTAAGLLFSLHRPSTATAASPAEPARPATLSAARTIGLCLGLISVAILLYFSLLSPTVIARWTAASYPLILLAVVAMLWLAGLLLSLRPRLLAALPPRAILAWNVLFTLALFATLFSRQIAFPPHPAGYPLAEPPLPWFSTLALAALLLLFPVLLVDWQLLIQALAAGRPTPRKLGLGWTVASFYLLLMVFAQVFTSVYDYIPVIGPLFRDRFAYVFLVPCLLLILGVGLTRRPVPSVQPAPSATPSRLWPALLSLVAIVTLAGAWFVSARTSSPSTPSQLTVFTYNIQQGYNPGGRWAYPAQLDVARQIKPDIIGLQECDTARIANGNQDVVRYWADQLDDYSYYGPTTVAGTFGIALLSRYPIHNPRTFFMYSEGEQTACIEAEITVGARTFTVFVTHLGNGGPLAQQLAVLQEVQGKENVILMGDFNFRPDTPQYRGTVAVLDDAWVRRWPEGNPSQGVDFADTIDHIFVSPGTVVNDARYLPGPASDHPAQMVVIGW